VTFASWSPDGTRIAVVRGSQIWLVSSEGGDPDPLPLPDWYAWNLVWSPDGARLAIDGQAASPVYQGPAGVTVFSVADRAVVAVPDLAQVAWSPDSHFFAAFDQNPTGCQGISVVRADGSGSHTIWSGECGSGQTMAWLP
jgi:hypothetical protein